MVRKLVILGALVVAIGEPRAANACTSDGRAPTAAQIAANAPDVFTWLEQAASVAEVEVTTAPGFSNEGHGLPGNVVLAVRRVVKGTPGKVITIVQEMTPCAGEAKGHTSLAFFDVKGHRLGAAPVALTAPLVAWQAAKTPADQSDVLAMLAASKDPLVAGAAAKRIAAIAWRAPAPAWRQPGTPALAIARARAQWPAIRVAGPTGRFKDFEQTLATKRGRLAAVKVACALPATAIRDTAGAADLGDPGALPAGDCWDVTSTSGFFTLNIYVSAADGRVVLVWIPPEG
ncbi:hypothetical protein BH11MYX1_BH11MYX1_14490 [soil metagenome]